MKTFVESDASSFICTHSKLIKKGASSRVIWDFVSETRNLSGNLLGKEEFLPMLRGEELKGFHSLMKTLYAERNKGLSEQEMEEAKERGDGQYNQYYQTDPTPTEEEEDNMLHMLLTPKAATVLFGKQNMKRADKVVEKIHTEWLTLLRKGNRMAKEQYVSDTFGFRGKIDWRNLPGIRLEEGAYCDSTSLYISGGCRGAALSYNHSNVGGCICHCAQLIPLVDPRV